MCKAPRYPLTMVLAPPTDGSVPNQHELVESHSATHPANLICELCR